MPAEARQRWTAKAVRDLIEQAPLHWPRYELVDGELLVSPSPRPAHALAHSWLFGRLLDYVSRERLGRMLSSPADIELQPETIVQPDLFLVPLAEAAQLREWADVRRLALVVEILSPSTAAFDRGLKRAHYQRNGVPEYWIVDLDSRIVERWKPNEDRPEVLRERLVWQPVGVASVFEVDLKELWQAAQLD